MEPDALDVTTLATTSAAADSSTADQRPPSEPRLRELVTSLLQRPPPALPAAVTQPPQPATRPGCVAPGHEAAAASTHERLPTPPGAAAGQVAPSPRMRSVAAAAAAVAEAAAAAEAGHSAAEVYLRALQQALSQKHYARGVIICGASSALVPVATAARCLLQAVGLTLKQPPAAAEPVAATKGGKAAATKKTAARRSAEEPPAAEPSIPDEWSGEQRVEVVLLSSVGTGVATQTTTELPAIINTLNLAWPGMSSRQTEGASTGGEATAASRSLQDAPAALPLQQEQQQQPREAFQAAGALERAFEADAAALAPVLGAMQPSNGPIRHRIVSAVGAEEEVAAAVVGVSFSLGRVATVLPPTEEDALRVPPPYELRILQRPKARPAKSSASNFLIWTLPPRSGCGSSSGADPTAQSSALNDAQEAAAQPADGMETLSSVAAPVSTTVAKKMAGNTPRKGKKGEATAVAEPAEPTAPEEDRWVH
jgi:hypothetical protein